MRDSSSGEATHPDGLDTTDRCHEASARAGEVAPKRYFLGTHRTCSPTETLARLRPLLPAMGITRIANVTGLDRTGIPVVMVCRPNSRSVAVSQGKGLTLEAAKASGVMEAVEVWHGEHIVKPLKLASLKEMRREHRVADVALLPLASGRLFSPDLALLWIEGKDLLGGDAVWIPFESVSTNYTIPLPPGSGCFQANTNGLASGNHPVEAICHGLCEVVERDATTLWRLQSPRSREERAIDPETVDDPDCQSVLAKLRAANLSVRIWETTSDFGIASFVCLVMELDGEYADPEFGSGCHPSRHVALLRALTEAAQARNTYISGARDDYPAAAWEDAYRRRRQAYCQRLITSSKPRGALAHAPNFDSPSLDGDLRWLLARLRAGGIEQAISVDLSKDAIGIPVVRVVVPGLEGAMEEAGGDYAPGPRARRFSRGGA
jgi:ribosomal protein S12 methylthiotransferase accessory factor